MFNIPYTQKLFKINKYSILDSPVPYAKLCLKEYDEYYNCVIFINNQVGYLRSPKNIEDLKEIVAKSLEIGFFNKPINFLFIMETGFITYHSISKLDNFIIINAQGKCIIKGDIDRCFKKELKIISLSKKIGYAIKKKNEVEGVIRADYVPFLVFVMAIAMGYLYITGVSDNTGYAIGIESVFIKKNYLALITYNFMHGSLMHVIGNILTLLVIGSSVERMMGSAKMFLIFMMGGIYAGVISCIYKLIIENSQSTVGASGGIFALFGAYMVVSIIESYNKFKQVIKSIVGAMLLILINGFDVTVDNACHIGGLVSGVLITVCIIIAEELIENVRVTRLMKSINKMEKKAYAGEI